MGIFLGLDASTQSLSAVGIDTTSGTVVLDEAVVFGRDLPEYHAPHGYLVDPDPAICRADPRMWAAALDELFTRLSRAGACRHVEGIAGAAQQHGSVYLSAPIDLDAHASGTLAEHVGARLSQSAAPIWLDSSTSTQCAAIEAAAGGRARVVETTGSRAIERFTAAQIRKLFETAPDAYACTKEIHLVSSFMTSLLVGRTSPIDLADAAGMNLLDLRTARWSETMMAACAPDLEGRLPAVTPSTRGVGAVASYHVERYGFRPHTPVGTFTGDNPSSLVGLGATTPGDTVVSLGTSDTYFAATAEPRVDPSGFGHVFGNPAGGFMSLVCFANGSLAREHVRDECGLGWAEFEAALASTPPGNDDNLLLPYFAPEMTPRIPDASPERIGSEAFVNGADAPASIRAVVEAQAITMRLHSTWFGPRPARIRVTGGASQNRGILQILADVLEADLQPLERSNASAMGAALRAAHVFGGTPWEALYARFAAPDPTRIVRSRPETRSTYARLTEAFERALQRKLVALSSLHPAG